MQRIDTLTGSLVALGLLLLLTFVAAAVGAAASVSAGEFYQSLSRPAWAPSPAVFGPVWTVLYTLIAIAAFLVVREVGWSAARVPLLLYVVQLAVNAIWTWLFFGWRMGGAALLDIAVLLVLVAVMAVVFWRVQPVAGILLLPYLGWVGFATALTWSVWRLNPGLL